MNNVKVFQDTDLLDDDSTTGADADAATDADVASGHFIVVTPTQGKVANLRQIPRAYPYQEFTHFAKDTFIHDADGVVYHVLETIPAADGRTFQQLIGAHAISQISDPNPFPALQIVPNALASRELPEHFFIVFGDRAGTKPISTMEVHIYNKSGVDLDNTLVGSNNLVEAFRDGQVQIPILTNVRNAITADINSQTLTHAIPTLITFTYSCLLYTSPSPRDS